ncbi:MAG: flavin monoamine oxidase family protein [Chloroflexota bacterium]
MQQSTPERDVLDLAVIGAGAAGTYVARAMKVAQPEWSISLFERTDRIGGRVWSVQVPGVAHRIELGGMRFMTTHPHVRGVVEELGIVTHSFDRPDGSDRSFLRGRFGGGLPDPEAGAGYDLAPTERGRSAEGLKDWALERILPGHDDLDAAGWKRARATHEHLGRPLTDRSIDEAFKTVLSEDAAEFVIESLGFDSGPRILNAGDGVQFFSGGEPGAAEALTPDEGMDRIPKSLAADFETRGGTIHRDSELRALSVEAGVVRLELAGGQGVMARRVVLATAIPALRMIAAASRPLQSPAFEEVLAAVEGFPATKLYVWYDRPWWLGEVSSARTVTDLPPRKVFYFDEVPDGPAVLLGSYADARTSSYWTELADGASNGAPATPRMLAALDGFLHELHPSLADIPAPLGSAFMHWGSDPHEIAWTLWLPGAVSDEVMAIAPQPDPSLPIYLAGESFSRSQMWVEGALETGAEVVRRLLAAR